MPEALMRRFVALTGLILWSLCASACATDDATSAALPKKQMIAAGHPLAVEAGLEILRAGGSAVDAAVTVQAVLGLVEPQSSGIGGGAFLLHYDPATGEIKAYDGRETAPASAWPEMFLGGDGTPMRFQEAWLSGRSVGVPGVIAMLEMAHRKHGKLPWSRLFVRAIELAEVGWPVSPRLAATLAQLPTVKAMPATNAYFFGPDGEPAKEGELIKNPDYAQTLRLIAANGSAGLLKGEVAGNIVNAVAQAPNHPATITLDDLAGYEPKERTVVCGPYRGWRICSMPPPSSGGVAVLQILGLIERFSKDELKPASLSSVHLVSEASRLAYADREMYLGDPDFVAVPVAGLINGGYLAERSKLIDPAKSMGIAVAGVPPGQRADLFAPDENSVEHGTSHFSIIDAAGHAVSMTTTVESAFGSHVMAGGFLLNNQLTDFSFEPVRDGKPVANAVAPGKRPRSSMSPVLAFDPQGKLRLIVGSPGGSRIIAYVAEALVGLIDGELSMQEAVALPHHVNRNGPTEIEENTGLVALAPQLTAMGHEVSITTLGSGLHGIRITDEGYDGGADPRGNGTAAGD